MCVISAVSRQCGQLSINGYCCSRKLLKYILSNSSGVRVLRESDYRSSSQFVFEENVFMKKYNFKKCQSLFGYALAVHLRSKGRCQLCGCGGMPLDFDLWRQLTVEHLIGKSQGGYLAEVKESVRKRFPSLSFDQQIEIAHQIDSLNTVSACSFCNSTTSRDINSQSMEDLLFEKNGDSQEVLEYIEKELSLILKRKKENVLWKLSSIKEAFETDFIIKLENEK